MKAYYDAKKYSRVLHAFLRVQEGQGDQAIQVNRALLLSQRDQAGQQGRDDPLDQPPP